MSTRFYQTGTFAVGGRLLDESNRSVQSDPERANAITKGHRACQGCGEALGARYALDAAVRATGGKLIAANGTGCLEVFSTPSPETSWRIPWVHSLFANAPSVATGVAAALRAKGRTDVRVVGQGGDGGTVDIGFACLSGMFERNDDVLYICYDNQGYMNTGVQRSAATPAGARTATTEPLGGSPGADFGQGKSAPLIAMAHEIPYVATATVAELRDLEQKVNARDGAPRRALYPRSRPLPARLGLGPTDHTIRSHGSRRRAACSRSSRPSTGASRRSHGFATRWRSRSTCAPSAASRTCSQAKAGRMCSRGCSTSRPQHRPLWTAGRRLGQRRGEHRLARRAGRRRKGIDMSDHRPYAITLDVGSSLANRTGDWRTERPVYVHNLPPCNHACPAGEDIQGWLYEAEAGGAGYESAWRKLVAVNPIPAIMGRVCYHPCETSCNRAQVDDAVGINAVERFLGDEAIRAGWQFPAPAPSTGKRVLVVGSGPSGLSVAYHLALRGHHVTIREQAAKPGGMMRYGIPTYRLPREVLDAEVARILALGVELECNSRIADVKSAMSEGNYDAAFLAVGAHVAKHTEIPGGAASHILDAVALLHGIEDGEKPQLGRRVVIYGGGDTALDAARSALRLGVSEPIIVYRRNREKMPAEPAELAEAEDEGIAFRWLTTIVGAEEGKLKIERMELDETGYPQPTGEYEDLEADAVVLALGQDADLALLEGLDGIEVADHTVKVDDHMMTGHPGVFAGGDMVPADRTVAVAIGHGHRAAQCIDAWLAGAVAPVEAERELASIDRINSWYYEDAPRTVRPQLEAIRRQTTFEEVVKVSTRTPLFSRRVAACPAGTASSVTTALVSAPTTP